MSSAIISEDQRYRYRLERIPPFDPACGLSVASVAIIMVNPSTANAAENDHTIRRILGFGQRHGWHRIIVGNKFAYRAADIKELRNMSIEAAIGPDNDLHLEQIMRDADFHVVAWGPLAKLPPRLRNRWKDVVRMAQRVGCPLYCLGTAADEQPRHPLFVPYDTPVQPWRGPWFPGCGMVMPDPGPLQPQLSQGECV